MPGRTPAAARDAFLSPLHQAISCVTNAQFIRSGGQQPGDDLEALTLSREPLQLRSAVPGGLQLRIRHRFRLVQESRSDWHVSTAAYWYRLDDDAGRELAAWHWHPQSRVVYPHAHVSGTPFGRLAHLPTGRVSIESVLRLLIGDLGVPARRADYAEVLDAAERAFIEHRRWHA
ncbi:MAG: hypothetical protein ACRDOH_05650 [Streptosporangiaceae bacterium]